MSRISRNLEQTLGPDHKLWIDDPKRPGWDDYLTDLSGRTGQGANAPTWAQWRGNIYGWEYTHTVDDELWGNIHILHDYSLNTPLFPHIHCSPNNTATGTVVWEVNYAIMKLGEVAADEGQVILTTEIDTASQYVHFLTEATAAQAANIVAEEVDTIIAFHLKRDVSEDTLGDGIHAFYFDLHYQKDKFSTINKEAPFNGPGVVSP